ncbi:hypothetical protein [Alkalicoccus urumqiensis]|uniref:Xanthine/uracil/vitamin C permease n=1 Tax=Alkalicoccus urumqiensis TaxID=1548213 RepID=A0A2P6MDY9_ALKUR|nr:hypothetical protein [Alkalicoccus urumqiensis]PRO64499.1 hypothetical protein C6I21_14320 [Alkalicoccus urumqiensis]
MKENRREQPGWKWGPFTARMPGIHLNLQPSQHIQGALMLLATCGAVTPLMMQYFGVSFEVAWTVSLFFLFWVIAQTVIFGDPYAAGAITAGLPITLVYIGSLTPGVAAIEGMTALFLVLIVLFLFFGITKLGEAFNNLFPTALKAGIIMGAGIAAFQSEINRLPSMPITLITAWVVIMVLMFSLPFNKLKDTKSKAIMTSNALLLSFGTAGLVGWIAGEVSFTIEWGFFIPPVAETVSTLSIWAVGIPGWDVFLSVIPIGIVIYILGFSDIVISNTLLKEADKARTDEKISIDPTRSHYTLAIRNMAQLMTAGPLLWIHGPLWTGVQIYLIERYKKGREFMKSIYDGPMNFYLLAIPFGLFLPIIGIITPLFPVALSVALLLTGFACAYVAMNMVHTNITRGLTLTIGFVIAMYGAAWGMGVGILLCLLLCGFRDVDKEIVQEREEEKEMEQEAV